MPPTSFISGNMLLDKLDENLFIRLILDVVNGTNKEDWKGYIHCSFPWRL
jgi:hypothetical protein